MPARLSSSRLEAALRDGRVDLLGHGVPLMWAAHPARAWRLRTENMVASWRKSLWRIHDDPYQFLRLCLMARCLSHTSYHCQASS